MRAAPAGNRGLTHSSDLTREGLAVNATPERPTCTIVGCDRDQTIRGYCGKHYQRLRKYGDPLEVRQGKPPFIDITGQRFGTLTAIARDVPGREALRWRLTCDCGGEAIADYHALKTGFVVACSNYVVHRQKPVVTYSGTHRRTRRAKGSPRNHRCANCGNTAREWAYDLNDPNELVEDGLRYSLNPDHYVPMCAGCHRKSDRRARAA